MTRDEWLRRLAAILGTAPPTAAEIEVILDLAGVAAHASERQAAPLACWMAASAGLDPAQALAAARSVATPAAGPDAGPGG